MFWDEVRIWAAKGVGATLGGMAVVGAILLLGGIIWGSLAGLNALRNRRRPR